MVFCQQNPPVYLLIPSHGLGSIITIQPDYSIYWRKSVKIESASGSDHDFYFWFLCLESILRLESG